MGGLDVIVCRELKDLYCKFGAAVWCAETTTGKTSVYHKRQARKWSNMISDVRPILFTSEFTLKQFRELLLKHFESELLNEIGYVSGLYEEHEPSWPTSCRNDFVDKARTALQKWVNGEYD